MLVPGTGGWLPIVIATLIGVVHNGLPRNGETRKARGLT
jgi:hypothetical protein